jgi:hypothetical protein
MVNSGVIMSVISTATAASSAVGLFAHGHKKGGLGAFGDTAGDFSGSGAQGAASTQGLFSSLLQSLEQVAGISTTGAAKAAAGTTAVTGTAAANGVKGAVGAAAAANLAAVNLQTPRAMGANVNTSA